MVFDQCLPDRNDRNGTDAGRFGTESAIYVCHLALYGFLTAYDLKKISDELRQKRVP